LILVRKRKHVSPAQPCAGVAANLFRNGISASTVQQDTAMDQSHTSLPGWHCPAETALDLLSGQWRAMIVFWLLDGPLRFNELQRRLGGITHRTLSRTLKEMEAAGLVTRRDYGEIPPRVDYALTADGESLKPVLQAMEAWAHARTAEARG
jgi:DNA-binding HxlR family transcriptional regulator